MLNIETLTKEELRQIVENRRVYGLEPRADLSWCDLSNLDLRKSNLTNCNFCGANLSGANMRGCDLTDARLLNTDLTGTQLDNAILKGAKIAAIGRPASLPENYFIKESAVEGTFLLKHNWE